MKLAIIGSRTFTDFHLLNEFMFMYFVSDDNNRSEVIFNNYKVTEIVSGGAAGADSIGEKWARVNHIPVTVFEPDWDKYGKQAGFIRNQLIIENCDMVIAFWDGRSKGTKNSIDIARSLKKPTFIIYI